MDGEGFTCDLGGPSDHVLDKITMSWSIDDGDIVPWSLKLPESNVYGDSSLTLSLQLVKNSSILYFSICARQLLFSLFF